MRDAKGKVVGHLSCLDETALFDVQIKRFHEYKRQLMNILHVDHAVSGTQRQIPTPAKSSAW